MHCDRDGHYTENAKPQSHSTKIINIFTKDNNKKIKEHLA
jgi:hypothetical protein